MASRLRSKEAVTEIFSQYNAYRMRRWAGENSGATAVEFSLLAIPLVFIVLGIIELSLMFAANAMLQGAVYDAARLIRTGQVQQAADPETLFQTALCDHASMFLDCAEIEYDVSTLGTFDEAGGTPVFDENGNMEDPGFDVGGAREIVLIHVTYLYPLMTPMIGNFLANYPDNRRLLSSTVALETEPYEFGDDDEEGE